MACTVIHVTPIHTHWGELMGAATGRHTLPKPRLYIRGGYRRNITLLKNGVHAEYYLTITGHVHLEEEKEEEEEDR